MFTRLVKVRLLVMSGVLLYPAMGFAGATHVGGSLAKFTLNHWSDHEAHVNFYQQMMNEHDHVPVAFADRHHLMARALSDHHFNEVMINRLLNHTDKFIVAHPCFSRFLDGELHLMQLHRMNEITGTHVSTKIISAAEGQSGGGSTSLAPLSSDPPSVAVPEPSSMILVGSAGIFVGGLLLITRTRPRQIV